MMKKTLKKFLFMVLTAVLALCAVLLVACNSNTTLNKPTEAGEGMFKTGAKTEVFIGSCVDTDDYIVKFDDALRYKLSYRYTDKSGETKTETVKGNTFYPTVETVYTLVYEVEKKDKILTGTFDINVYDNPPVIEVSELPLTYEKGDTVSFKVLTMAANPYSEDVSKFDIEKVTYRKHNIDLEETVVEGSEKETVFDNGETEFTFGECGSYTFTLAGTADGKTSRADFRVEVVDPTKGNADVLKKDDEYVMHNAEVEGDKVRLVQAE